MQNIISKYSTTKREDPSRETNRFLLINHFNTSLLLITTKPLQKMLLNQLKSLSTRV